MGDTFVWTMKQKEANNGCLSLQLAPAYSLPFPRHRRLDARHDYGTRVLMRTGNLAALMRTMGHRDVKTAMHFQHPELVIVRSALDYRPTQSPKQRFDHAERDLANAQIASARGDFPILEIRRQLREGLHSYGRPRHRVQNQVLND